MPDVVILSADAAVDLEGIHEWISTSASPAVADQFVDRVFARCESLRHFPRQGRLRPELREGARSIAFGSYVVFYEEHPSAVTILRIVHGARDLSRILQTSRFTGE